MTDLEILEANYWEHYKYAKDLAQFLPLNNPKRLLLEKEMSKMIEEINNKKKEDATIK